MNEPPTILPDRVLDTDGIRQYATVPFIQHNIGTGDFTWALWVKSCRLSSPYEAVLGNGRYSPGMYTRTRADGAWGLHWRGRDLSSGVNIAMGAWYHLAVTRIKGEISFYTNGELALDDEKKGDRAGCTLADER